MTEIKYFILEAEVDKINLITWNQEIEQERKSAVFDLLNNGKFKLLYLLGSDNLEIKKNKEFVIYQGSHGDRGAEMADLILPSAAFTEQNSLYENLEGRIQECRKASYPIGEAKEDWKIFNLIMKKIDQNNINFKFELLRKEAKEKIINFTEINELPEKTLPITKDKDCDFVSEKILIKPLDYYYSNSISRASKTMSECRQIKQNSKKTGTNNL